MDEELLGGRYRVGAMLGRGGMGEVYRAVDVARDRLVALKTLSGSADERYAGRLRREAELVSRLADPHIVDVFDTGDSDDGGLYVAMRLVEGPDLRRVLAEGPLDPQRAVGILSQVAQALDAAHTGGVVHRDVKPSNILIGPDGDAHLTDFGIARPLEPGVTRLTRTGAYVGSLDYIAPEQLRGRDVTGTADVYSLACVLYECLTGKVPFPAADPAAKLAAQLNDPPAAPSVFDPRIPPALDMVVATGMDKDPQRRFASAGELMARQPPRWATVRPGIARSRPLPATMPSRGRTSWCGPSCRWPRGVSSGRTVHMPKLCRRPAPVRKPCVPTPVCAASAQATPRGSTDGTPRSPSCWYGCRGNRPVPARWSSWERQGRASRHC